MTYELKKENFTNTHLNVSLINEFQCTHKMCLHDHALMCLHQEYVFQIEKCKEIHRHEIFSD